MFYSITGKIVFADVQSVALETGGIAFRCNTTLTTRKALGEIGSVATLYTYLNVREDALDSALQRFKNWIALNRSFPFPASVRKRRSQFFRN